jgi:hypothetical protein
MTPPLWLTRDLLCLHMGRKIIAFILLSNSSCTCAPHLWQPGRRLPGAMGKASQAIAPKAILAFECESNRIVRLACCRAEVIQS